MTQQAQSVLESALALSETERALLVERLLDMLSAGQDELGEEELFAELERRRAEVDQGAAKTIPWSEFDIEG